MALASSGVRLHAAVIASRFASQEVEDLLPDDLQVLGNELFDSGDVAKLSTDGPVDSSNKRTVFMLRRKAEFP